MRDRLRKKAVHLYRGARLIRVSWGGGTRRRKCEDTPFFFRPVCSNAPLTIEIGKSNKHLYAVDITSLSF